MSMPTDGNTELTPNSVPDSAEPHTDDAVASMDGRSFKHLAPRACSLAKLDNKKRIHAVWIFRP